MGSVLAAPTEPLPQELMIHIRAEAARNGRERRRRRQPYRTSTYVRREDKVRDILQTPTRHEWPSCRPHWCINARTSRRMEIDCLCEPLKACCEVDGLQHFERTWHHKTREDYERQRARDHMKDRIVQAMGYRMIRVPHRGVLDDSQLCEFLICELARLNIYAGPITTGT